MCCLIAALALVCAQGASKVVVPAVAMEDQFGQAHDVQRHRGDVVVLIYGDRASAKANGELGERLHVHFHPSAKGLPPEQAKKAAVKPVPGATGRSPDVLAVPVACFTKNVPELVRKLIRDKIKGASPHVPVWLDFADQMRAQFPYKEGAPNVVVLDAKGRYRYAAAGEPTAQGVERLIAVIEELRKEALVP